MKAIALILMAISLDLRDASLVDALKQVEEASGLRLVYEQELVESAEPVTLKVENVPTAEVLRRILRPRGLEFIQTSDTMAAIVPADSDMGMAKAAGRALRTFARLERKLEGAEQHGDEVKVPGWTDDDDRALAEKYDALPWDACTELVNSAARAKEAPGAEAFVIRFLKDKERDRWNYRFNVLNRLHLPLTQTLRTALEELEKDPGIGTRIRATIQRLEQNRQ